MNPDDINREVILTALRAIKNPYLPTQVAVSLLWVRRYYSIMARGVDLGEKMGNLKISLEKNAISDGHHRYICHVLLNYPPDITDWTIGHSQAIYTWENITFTEEDYDKNYNEFMASVT